VESGGRREKRTVGEFNNFDEEELDGDGVTAAQ
jgi:hypothetical protein